MSFCFGVDDLFMTWGGREPYYILKVNIENVKIPKVQISKTDKNVNDILNTLGPQVCYVLKLISRLNNWLEQLKGCLTKALVIYL